jgi:hypothetical protein
VEAGQRGFSEAELRPAIDQGLEVHLPLLEIFHLIEDQVERRVPVVTQASFLRWVKEDDSEKNKEWINGNVEAFQVGLAGKL